MSNSPLCDREDLPLLAMRLLSTEEAARIQEQIVASAACQHDFQEVREDLSILAIGVPVEKPSESARDRLLHQVARERSASLRLQPFAHTSAAPVSRLNPLQPSFAEAVGPATLPEQRSPHATSSQRWLRWSGWAVAAGIALLAAGLLRDRTYQQTVSLHREAEVSRLAADAASSRAVTDALGDPDSIHVKLAGSGSSSSALGSAVYAPRRGTLIFAVSHLAPAQPHKAYQLWIIPADGRAPVPAGTFRPDREGSTSVVSSDLPRDVAAKAFGVTLETENGATSPTLPILMAGKVPQPSI